MSSNASNQIRALTGLRYFAAALVVTYHFSNVGNRFLRNFIEHGAFGVTIFFVLSGFILAYSYELGPGNMRGSKRTFWFARVARLYPTYLVGVALMTPIVLFHSADPVWQRVSSGALSLVLAQSWFHSLGISWGMWNPPGWSLSAEAFFYLVFPVACMALSRLTPMRLAVFAFVCWGLGTLSVFTQQVFELSAGNVWGYVPLLRIPEFLIGMAAGLIWKRRKTSAFDRAAPSITMLSAAALIFLMCLRIDKSWYFSGAFAPVVALFICALACGRGFIARILSSQALVVLGGASYSVYILHWPVWMIGKELFGKSELALNQPHIYFGAYLIFTTIVSYVCFKYFEEPLNRILRRKLIGPSSTLPHAAHIVAQHERRAAPVN